jgi:hypothetical protein
MNSSQKLLSLDSLVNCCVVYIFEKCKEEELVQRAWAAFLPFINSPLPSIKKPLLHHQQHKHIGSTYIVLNIYRP